MMIILDFTYFICVFILEEGERKGEGEKKEGERTGGRIEIRK